MTSDGVNSYTYDSANRLISINSGASSYAYDGMGDRYQQTVDGNIKPFDLNLNYSRFPAVA